MLPVPISRGATDMDRRALKDSESGWFLPLEQLYLFLRQLRVETGGEFRLAPPLPRGNLRKLIRALAPAAAWRPSWARVAQPGRRPAGPWERLAGAGPVKSGSRALEARPGALILFVARPNASAGSPRHAR